MTLNIDCRTLAILSYPVWICMPGQFGKGIRQERYSWSWIPITTLQPNNSSFPQAGDHLRSHWASLKKGSGPTLRMFSESVLVARKRFKKNHSSIPPVKMFPDATMSRCPTGTALFTCDTIAIAKDEELMTIIRITVLIETMVFSFWVKDGGNMEKGKETIHPFRGTISTVNFKKLTLRASVYGHAKESRIFSGMGVCCLRWE